MADHGRRRQRTPARLVAPLALLIVFGAVGYVIASSTDSNDDGGGDRGDRSAEQRPSQRGRQGRRRPQRAFYTVKLNDTLELIAEKTAVSVERLQQLNPELDPQNLTVGQRIKLRE
jgi:LysM repeat protein